MKWAGCLLFVASVATALPADKKAKAFSLFSVVSFPNEQCQTMMAGMVGVCVTSDECDARTGGTASGNCASGFGVCCLTQLEGTAAAPTVMVTDSLTYIQNENFPTTVGSTAPVTAAAFMYQIQSGTGNAQIRLDFDLAVFEQPSAAGACGGGRDSVTIAPLNGVFNTGLCGTFSGQHMFVDSGRRATGTTITISTSATALAGRTWKILVTFIPVGSADLAPPNCAQYFTANAGTITSFNNLVAGGQGTMLQGQLYEVCIRRNPGFTRVTYSENPRVADAFRLRGAPAAGKSGVGTGACLTTPEGVVIRNTAALIYCGDFLNPTTGMTNSAPVTSTGTGIIVVSDNGARAAGTSAFELNYAQIP